MRLRAWSSAEARPSASEWRAAAAAEMAWPSTEVTWRNSCSDSGASLRVPKLYSEMISRVWRGGGRAGGGGGGVPPAGCPWRTRGRVWGVFLGFPKFFWKSSPRVWGGGGGG